MNGIDANYLPELRARDVPWRTNGYDGDPLAAFAQRGVNAFRLRLWTTNTETALTLATQAQQAGMTVLPVLFLSDNWADYVKQPVPAEWQDSDLTGKCGTVAGYAARTAIALRERGIRANLYAIGNEIDFGICGEFEERWERRVSPDWLRQEVWPRAAAIIAAAQQGVRTVNPAARFVIHLTQWWNVPFCRAMLSALREHGVQVDVIGLSYYPTAPMSEQRDFSSFFASTDTLAAAFNCPVIICEYAYPASAEMGGQFSDWNHAAPGYPLTPEGQARWLKDFLVACRADAHIAGAFYWSPEWHADEMWRAFALFDERGNARPALSSLDNQ
ncbi:MAG: hypothetical protein A2107_03880 [Verrucomicrobia bacterium GWF2_62_7]|nr:MAG: hypothetical protein A2107_03880 [Verrucomicrobia bacterium GWF2_62_7]